jgi:hypothetical protein
MKTRKRICYLEFRQLQISLRILSILLFMKFNVTTTFAQNNVSTNSATSVSGNVNTTRTLFGGTITNRGYGGIVLKFSSFNDQFAFITGGAGCNYNQ